MSANSRSKEFTRFSLFTVVGGIAALLNILSRVLFNVFVPFELSIVFAFCVGLTAAFVMNRRFVFDAEHGNAAAQYGRFALVNLVALTIIVVVSMLMVQVVLPLIGWTWHAETVAHVTGVMSPILLSYHAHKHFSFRRGRPKEPYAGTPGP
jgi:putative flippase GtrA